MYNRTNVQKTSLSHLLNHFNRITSELEMGKGVDVIKLDFAKAFDKLDHGITLKKLKFLWIDALLDRPIETFFKNRTQTVEIDGQESAPSPVISKSSSRLCTWASPLPSFNRRHWQGSYWSFFVFICWCNQSRRNSKLHMSVTMVL